MYEHFIRIFKNGELMCLLSWRYFYQREERAETEKLDKYFNLKRINEIKKRRIRICAVRIAFCTETRGDKIYGGF